MFRLLTFLNDANFLNTNWRQITASLVTVLIAAVIIVVLAVKSRNICVRRKSNASKYIRPLFAAIQGIVLLTGVLFIMLLWEINTLPFLILIFILAIFLGVSLQNVLKDYFGSIVIAHDNYYDVGDTIEINGFRGIVKEVTSRSTTLVSWKGEVKTIANRTITEVINFSKEPSVGYVDIVLSNTTDVDKAIDLLVDNLNKINETYPQVLEGPNVIGVVDISTIGTTIRIIVKTESNESGIVERGIRKFVRELFDQHQIEIAHNR